MKRPDIAKRLARQSGVSEAEAADRRDGVVRQILEKAAPWAGRSPTGTGPIPLRAGREALFRTRRRQPLSTASPIEELLGRLVAHSVAEGIAVEIEPPGRIKPRCRFRISIRTQERAARLCRQCE